MVHVTVEIEGTDEELKTLLAPSIRKTSPEDEVTRMRRLRAGGMSVKQIAQEVGYHPTTVYKKLAGGR